MKIWCLFSIDNEYNQPKHNLESWWNEKPDISKLRKVIQFDNESLNELLKNGVLKEYGVRKLFLTEVEEGIKL